MDTRSYGKADRELAAKVKRKNQIHTKAKFEKIFNEMHRVVMSQFSRDSGVSLALETLEREYVVWMYNNDLIIDDPQIIIDALKGEEK